MDNLEKILKTKKIVTSYSPKNQKIYNLKR